MWLSTTYLILHFQPGLSISLFGIICLLMYYADNNWDLFDIAMLSYYSVCINQEYRSQKRRERERKLICPSVRFHFFIKIVQQA